MESAYGILFFNTCCSHKFIVFMLSQKKKKKSEEFAPLKFKDTKIRFTKLYEKYRVTSSALGNCTSKHKNFAIVFQIFMSHEFTTAIFFFWLIKYAILHLFWIGLHNGIIQPVFPFVPQTPIKISSLGKSIYFQGSKNIFIQLPWVS